MMYKWCTRVQYCYLFLGVNCCIARGVDQILCMMPVTYTRIM